MHDTQNHSTTDAVPDSSGDQSKVSVSKRQQQIQGLRDLADFYEKLPEDFPFVYALEDRRSLLVFLRDNPKEQLARIGAFEKRYEDDPRFGFIAVKKIGPWELQVHTQRDKVCVRRVVGTKPVPAVHIPERVIPSQFIPAHEEEIVEWDCEPVLATKEV